MTRKGQVEVGLFYKPADSERQRKSCT